MQAAEAKIQKVLEGSKQFLVPHYQRPYSWKEEQWTALWRDLLDLLEHPEQEPHFLGSIVSSPARSVPEGIEKRLLIDGQQRLTTVLTLLTLLRDRARDAGSMKLAEKIQDLVTNRHEEGHEQQKLLPTQGEDPADSDRETFTRLVAGAIATTTVGIGAAYHFFDTKLRRPDAPDLETLFRAIVTRLTLVSIILDDKDNPHRIFESLNGKGRPLSQVDLIRNYFFMRIPEREHEHVYVDLWRPMQRRLGEEALPSFVRHYLMRTGQIVRETDVYSALKKLIDDDREQGPVHHLKELARFAGYYEFLLKPSGAPTATIGERIARLNRMEVTVAYPLLLSVFADRAAGKLDDPAVVTILDVLENYLVRRFVCGVPTHGLAQRGAHFGLGYRLRLPVKDRRPEVLVVIVIVHHAAHAEPDAASAVAVPLPRALIRPATLARPDDLLLHEDGRVPGALEETVARERAVRLRGGHGGALTGSTLAGR